MIDYTNPYVRLQFYNSTLINDSSLLPIDDDYDYGIPMDRLSEISKISIQTIRNDVIEMLRWYDHIRDVHSEYWDEKNCTFKNRIEFCLTDTAYEDLSTDELSLKILSGELDHIPLTISKSFTSNEYRLSITQDEAQALNALTLDQPKAQTLRKINSLNQSFKTTIYTKDSYAYDHDHKNTIKDMALSGSENLIQKLDRLNQAILNHDCLHMEYVNSHKNTLRFDFRPLKLSYDTDTNHYSVLSIYRKKIHAYRLDRILLLAPARKTLPPEDESLLLIAPCVWGNAFSDSPIHVKVKFYNEAHVWDKVKKDLACRTNGSLYEKDGYLYYEDTVYGINKFRSWVYGYGSSAIVLAPDSLRKEIIDSLQQRYNYYTAKEIK